MDIGELGLLLLTNFLGGSSFFATAYALKGFSALGVVFWRLLLTSLIFLPFLPRVLKSDFSKGDWLRMATVGILGYAAPLLVGAFGQNISNATTASLLMSLEPASMIFLSAIFLSESLTVLKMVALALSVAGSCLIVWPDLASLSHSSLGDVLLALQGFLFALYSVVGKPALRKIDALSFTAMTTFFGFLPMILLAWPFSSLLPLGVHRFPALTALAYLSLAVTFLGAWTWNKALQKIPASKMAHFIFLQPLTGVLLGVFALKEPLTPWSFGGGIFILAGVYCATREPEDFQSA